MSRPVIEYGARWCTAKFISSLSDVSWRRPSMTPALLTSVSTVSARARISRTTASMPACVATSPAMNTAGGRAARADRLSCGSAASASPRRRSRPTRINRCPAAGSCRAADRPMPEVAPTSTIVRGRS
jgi:hypothetical protein